MPKMYKAEKKILLTINFTRPVGQVLYEFQSSEAKTYLSQTSGWVKVFCPAWASSPFEGFHEKFCETLIFPPCYSFCMFSCSFCPSFKFKFKFKFKKEWKSYLLTNQIWPCLYVLSLILFEILFLSLLLPIISTWRCPTRKLLLLWTLYTNELNVF